MANHTSIHRRSLMKASVAMVAGISVGVADEGPTTIPSLFREWRAEFSRIMLDEDLDPTEAEVARLFALEDRILAQPSHRSSDLAMKILVAVDRDYLRESYPAIRALVAEAEAMI